MNDRIYIPSDLVITDFEAFKKECEVLESLGYRLDIINSCYER